MFLFFPTNIFSNVTHFSFFHIFPFDFVTSSKRKRAYINQKKKLKRSLFAPLKMPISFRWNPVIFHKLYIFHLHLAFRDH